MQTNVYREILGFRCLDHIAHQTNDLFLTRCGIQECEAGYSWGPKLRRQYHMHFIMSGKGRLEINGASYDLQKDQIFLIYPNTTAYYCADYDEPWTYAFISFHGNKAEQYMRQAGFSPECCARDCIFPTCQYVDIVRDMLTTHQLTLTNELRRVSMLFQLVSMLTDSHLSLSKSDVPHEYLPETYFEHALQYIQLNYHKNIQIQDIADYIGITRSYLHHIFTRKENLSPQKFLLNYRVAKAKELLSTTDTRIKDVALNVGYADSLAFSKIFRSHTGLSPSAYREQTSHAPSGKPGSSCT